MKPHCDVCGIDAECKLVSFKATKKDVEHDEEFGGIEGFVERPEYVAVLCHAHAEIAKNFTKLTKSQALQKIKEASE